MKQEKQDRQIEEKEVYSAPLDDGEISLGNEYEIKKTGEMVISRYEVKEVASGKIVEFIGQVNDKDISIGKARYKSPINGSPQEKGLWISVKESKLDYHSGLAIVLRKYNAKSLKDMIQKKVSIVRDSDLGFWIISAM